MCLEVGKGPVRQHHGGEEEENVRRVGQGQVSGSSGYHVKELKVLLRSPCGHIQSGSGESPE